MEELKRMYNEFVNATREVSERVKHYKMDLQKEIEFEEGRLSAFFRVCYLMNYEVPKKIIDEIKSDFEYYKLLID